MRKKEQITLLMGRLVQEAEKECYQAKSAFLGYVVNRLEAIIQNFQKSREETLKLVI